MRTKIIADQKKRKKVVQAMNVFINKIASRAFEVDNKDRGKLVYEAAYEEMVEVADDLRAQYGDLILQELESTPDPFAEMCVHTICNAFYREEDAGFEFHPKLGSVSEHVKGLPGNPAGTFNYVKSIADLKIVCDDLLRLGETYYVFWDEGLYEIEGEDDPGVDSNWIVWTPNRVLPDKIRRPKLNP